jgi:hypothetical protein
MKTVKFPRACVVDGVTYQEGEVAKLEDAAAERVVWLGFAETAQETETKARRGRKPKAQKEVAHDGEADNA